MKKSFKEWMSDFFNYVEPKKEEKKYMIISGIGYSVLLVVIIILKNV